MNRIILIIVIASSGISLKAQTNLDSLYNVWQDDNLTDTVRVKAFQTYVWSGFIYSQPDTAFLMGQEIITFSKQKGYRTGEAMGLLIQGISNTLQGNLSKAILSFEASSIIREETGSKYGVASNSNNIGTIYDRQGQYTKALEYYIKSLKIAEEIGAEDLSSSTLGNIGVIYNTKGNNSKALEYFNRSLETFERIGNKHGISRCLANIAGIYSTQKNHTKAHEFLFRSLKILEELGDQGGVSNCLGNIGNIYTDQGDYTKAEEFHNRSLKINTEIKNKNGISSALNSLGHLNIKKGNYPSALKFCKQGLTLAEETGALVQQKTSCQCMYNSYKALGDGNKALAYMEKMNVIDDSLHSEETAKKLQQMEFAKQVLADSLANAEEARIIDQAHQEEVSKKNRTRNMLAGAGLLILLLAGGIYSRLRYVRKSKAIIEEEKDRSNNLLLNILPADIAEELKIHGKAEARDFDMVSILFTDFKGFTAASAKLTAQELVSEINTCFEAFDGTMGKYNIEKIKTIGDAYMAAGGLPVPTDDSIKKTVFAAIEMQAFISKRKAEMDAVGKPAFEMRVGIHTGPVVAGIVGVKKFQYDIWGDTVNTAARMESSGAVGKVNISQSTYDFLKDDPDFTFESRGKIEAKGKGEMEMYFVSKTYIK